MPLPHSKNIFDYPARFQFNQPGTSFKLERTACTDTVVQMIIEYYLDKTVSLTNIRHASGIGTDGLHGLTMQGALNALEAYGITWYKPATNVTATNVLQKAHIGPVLTGVGYNQYPSMKGKRCSQGNVAQYGGRVDCDFKDAHAVLVIGSTPVRSVNSTIVRYDVFVRDPDHWLETPKYDRFKGAQLTKAMKALVTDTPWSTTFAIYPTKKK